MEGILLSSVLDSTGPNQPNPDYGYTVTDYKNVDRIFGTLQDFDDLVTAAHGKGISAVSAILRF